MYVLFIEKESILRQTRRLLYRRCYFIINNFPYGVVEIINCEPSFKTILNWLSLSLVSISAMGRACVSFRISNSLSLNSSCVIYDLLCSGWTGISPIITLNSDKLKKKWTNFGSFARRV